MKNVFFIVLDSFVADKLGNTKYGPSPTPFLDELCKKSLVCTNMYSQGPYTEAGSRALLTGFDSLDYGGYMHNLYEAKVTYLEVFKQAGYSIFDFFLPFYMYSTREFNNIDYTFFTSDFIFDSVWNYRLSHFSEIKSKRTLSNTELDDVIKQVELTFIAWGNFFEKWRKGEKQCFKCMMSSCKQYNWEDNYAIFKKEYDAYLQDPISYSLNLLDEGKNCNLYKIQKFDFGKALDEVFIDENIFRKRAKFLKKISKQQIFLNIRNQKIEYTKLFKSFVDSIKKREITGYLRQFVYTLCCGRFAKGYRPNQFYQYLPSLRNILRTSIDEIMKNKGDKPFMLHCHPEELHNRVNYFSFDIQDENLINREFDIFEKYLDSININYHGNLLYDCSLLYVDDCIREFYSLLEKNSLLKDSVIVLCADHGSSYDCNIIRENVVNNCHTENYHIPLIIYDGSNPKGTINNKYHTSKDILATMCDICNIPKSLYMTGQSIKGNCGEDVAVSEYLGSGCPDLRDRPIIFIARNSNYLINYQVGAFDKFESGNLEEVYNIKKDPYELKNLAKSIESAELTPLMDAIKKRHSRILCTYKELHQKND